MRGPKRWPKQKPLHPCPALMKTWPFRAGSFIAVSLGLPPWRKTLTLTLSQRERGFWGFAAGENARYWDQACSFLWAHAHREHFN